MTDLTSIFSFNTPTILEFQFHSSWTVDKNSTSQDGNGVCRMEHDLQLSQTLQHIHQLKYRLKPTPLAVCSPPHPRMGNVRRKYMHTVVYKWFLVTGSLHARHIKVRLRLKFRSTGISRRYVSCSKFVLHRCYLQAMDPYRKQHYFLYFSASQKWTYFSHKLCRHHIQRWLLIPPEVSRLVFTYFRILKWFVGIFLRGELYVSGRLIRLQWRERVWTRLVLRH